MRRSGLAGATVVTVLVAACGGTTTNSAGAGASAAASAATPGSVASPAGAADASAGGSPKAEAPKAAPVIDPPPPSGVVVPRGVRVVSAENGGVGYSWYWQATLAADPVDIDLRARVETARAAGTALTLGEAALARHREDVEAAGHEVTGFAFMPGFDYTVNGERGLLAVFVRVPGNDPHGAPRDPSVAVADEHGPFFGITVGPAGG